ncbi:hypothetical protein DPMN_047518 [Dreissena polymorpha]|uniref:Uncharacterized protein n=1 Tax=Dreissena polymorpha TaxID=45954 RepID=A0A9D4D8V2_DREPO|nr:hypothetical protein DPMN_047518 [Dreissena polymorpha]
MIDDVDIEPYGNLNRSFPRLPFTTAPYRHEETKHSDPSSFCLHIYVLLTLDSETERKKSRDYFHERQIICTKYNMTDIDFNILRRNIIQSVPYKAGSQWKFAATFYFALGVITTIGRLTNTLSHF